MRTSEKTHDTNQALGQRLSNQILQARFNILNVGRLLMSTISNKSIMKKTEATTNDAVIAFSPNAKRYLSKMFYPIAVVAIFACMMFFTSNTAKAVPCWLAIHDRYEFDTNCCITATFWYPSGCPHTYKVYTSGTNGNQTLVGSFNLPDSGEHSFTICPDANGEIKYSLWVVVPPLNPGGPILETLVLHRTFTKEQVDSCKNKPPRSCYDIDSCIDVNWIKDTIIIKLDDFPNCPLTYTYEIRSCGGETQVKGGQISFRYSLLGGDCLSLLLSLLADDGSLENPHTDPDKVKQLFEDAFRKKADMLFDSFKLSIPDSLRIDMLGCDNPYFNEIITSYYKATCVSYCSSMYYEQNNDLIFEMKEDNCIVGEACCKLSRKYCLDSLGNIVLDEKKEVVGINFLGCDPYALPEEQSCRTHNVIFNTRSTCRPSCE